VGGSMGHDTGRATKAAERCKACEFALGGGRCVGAKTHDMVGWCQMEWRCNIHHEHGWSRP
jgi:hypothetical protein